MTEQLVLAIIQSLPSLMALVQNMITDFQSGNSPFTESDIIAIQNQVSQNSAVANKALIEIMNAKSAAAANTHATVDSTPA
jgi:hypothetical protein